MARDLKQSTAVVVVVGPAVSVADGIATVDAATVTSITCGIKKAGTAGAAITLSASGGNNDLTPTANNPGYYDQELTTGNTDTLGPLRLTYQDPDVLLPFFEDFNVLTAAEYDRKYSTGHTVEDIYTAVVTNAAGTDVAADIIALKTVADAILVDTGTTLDGRIPAALVSGRMDCSVGAMANDTVTAAAVANGAIDAATFAAGAIDAGAIADNAIDAGAIATGAITAAKFAAGAIDAAAIANGAIDNATFAADVGSTAYATNIIALACDKTAQNGVKVTSMANDTITAAVIATGAVDADAIADNAIDAGAIAANAIAAAKIATGAITSSTFAAGAINAAAIADGAIDNATFAADVGSTAYATNIIALAADKAGQNGVNVTKLDGASLSTHASGMIAADVRDIVGSAVSTTTAQLGVNAVSLTNNAITANAIASNAIAAAKIATGAITNATFAAGAIDAAAIADNAIDAAALASDVTTEIQTGMATAADIADAVWDEAISGHTTAGTTGKYLSDAGTGASAATIADAVWDEALEDHDDSGSTGEALAAYAAPASVADIADGVWDEVLSGHTASGSSGERMGRIPNAAAAGNGGLPTVNASNQVAVSSIATGGIAAASFAAGAIDATAIADNAIDAASIATGAITNAKFAAGAIDATAIASNAIAAAKIATGAITNAKFAANAIDAAAIADSAIDIATFAADVKTGNYINAQVKGRDNLDFGALEKASLNAATPASVVGAVGSVTGAVGSVTGNVGGNVTGSVGSLATQAKADVNAEVVDALSTDAQAEPGQGAPLANASLAAKVNYLFKWMRNKKTNDGSVVNLYNDDGSTVDQKRTVADSGTTATMGEIGTGP